MDNIYTLDKKPQSVTSKCNLDLDPNVANLTLQNKNMSLVYIGENYFDNTTDSDQTYTTTNYSKTITESTTSTTTKGFTLNGDGIVFKAPFFIDNKKVTANFNSSKSEAITDTTSITLTSGAQSVNVPAHKKYKVVVNLSQIEYEGTVNYHATGDSLSTYINTKGMWIDMWGNPKRKSFDFDYSIGSEWNSLTSSQKADIKELTINPTNNTMKVNGIAKLTGVTGSQMIVNTIDITNQQNTLVNTQIINF
ncbi:ETX/MTX2 family pore-forming toxin [Enterococcus faecalis]|uniref:ETX/MTX2 family pore-forming toxin n=1 Tax=Enterococcus faecalis TaxID=1351 RepID=UPI0027E0DD7F|nr:ETX/MTX2 family pore-forming toxin [Enterococcus faecalis]MDQ6186799.1 ETX/MTX2 family pore-forming toxin [Enterococcus faecalis]MDQ6225571.1 ETX/MTX2 family pore-forming toxin [Enterococcus faecalis]